MMNSFMNSEVWCDDSHIRNINFIPPEGTIIEDIDNSYKIYYIVVRNIYALVDYETEKCKWKTIVRFYGKEKV